MKLDLATVLHATNASVLEISETGQIAPAALSAADLRQCFVDVQIDSRTATDSSLFFALAGSNADGHDFVGQALRAGASACVVSRTRENEVLTKLKSGGAWHPGDGGAETSRLLLVVSDPLRTLQRLARFWRRRHAAEIVGVTGSIGKTTTKELVASVLSARVPVLKSEANFNTEIGLPLTLLRLTSDHRVGVLEMGMYAPGDIRLLATIAEPGIGIVTNVAPIHLERLRSIERIARAKSELVAGLPPDGLAVLNGDDPWTLAMARSSGLANTVLVGLTERCDFRALDVTPHGLAGMSFTVAAEGTKTVLHSRIPGSHNVHAILAAAATARAIGMEWDDIQSATAQAALGVRQKIIQVSEQLLIVDDSYNAAPQSMQAALDLLEQAPGTKIAVLGDMLELGDVEHEAHSVVGRRAAGVSDWLVVRGSRAAWIATAAAEAGFPRTRIVTAASNPDAVNIVRHIMSRGKSLPSARRAKPVMAESANQAEWSVLVKGSRGMRMEEIVHGLRGAE